MRNHEYVKQSLLYKNKEFYYLGTLLYVNLSSKLFNK